MWVWPKEKCPTPFFCSVFPLSDSFPYFWCGDCNINALAININKSLPYILYFFRCYIFSYFTNRINSWMKRRLFDVGRLKRNANKKLLTSYRGNRLPLFYDFFTVLLIIYINSFSKNCKINGIFSLINNLNYIRSKHNLIYPFNC